MCLVYLEIQVTPRVQFPCTYQGLGTYFHTSCIHVSVTTCKVRLRENTSRDLKYRALVGILDIDLYYVIMVDFPSHLKK